MGQGHVGGEGGVGGGVVQAVGDVGEEGALRFQALGDGDRVGEVGVAGVGFVAEGVDDQDVQVLEHGVGLFG